MTLPIRKTAMVWIVLISAMVLSVWVKAFWCSAADFRSAQTYLADKHYTRAITFFDRSMRWYAPLNPYVHRSAQQLWEIAGLCKQRGDIRLALVALHTIRQGFYASRSFFTPGAEWIRQCDAEIASLTDYGHKEPGTTAHAKTRRDAAPDTFWSFMVEIGLMGWVGSVLAFLYFGLIRAPVAAPAPKQAVIWGALCILFYALWIIAMTRA